MRKRKEETHSLESLARQAQHEETESLSGEERGQKLSLRKCYGLNCVSPRKRYAEVLSPSSSDWDPIWTRSHSAHGLSSHLARSALVSLRPCDGSHAPDGQTQGEWGSLTVGGISPSSLSLPLPPVPSSQLLPSSPGPHPHPMFSCYQLILGTTEVNSPEATAMGCFRCRYLLRTCLCTSPRQNGSFWISDKGCSTSE